MRAPCMNVFGWVMSLILKVNDLNKPLTVPMSNCTSDDRPRKHYKVKETEENGL